MGGLHYWSMGDKNKRPVFLNLLQIRLPIGGAVSILHRATGVALTLLTPVFLYMLDSSLRDSQAFARYVAYFSSPLGRFNALLTLWLVLQHLLSGVRHLLLDLDIGIGRADARRSAWVTLVLSLAIVLSVGMMV